MHRSVSMIQRWPYRAEQQAARNCPKNIEGAYLHGIFGEEDT